GSRTQLAIVSSFASGRYDCEKATPGPDRTAPLPDNAATECAGAFSHDAHTCTLGARLEPFGGVDRLAGLIEEPPLYREMIARPGQAVRMFCSPLGGPQRCSGNGD